MISPENSGLTPWQIIQTYDDKKWEVFIGEWATAFEPPYHQIVPLGGAGDQGRDIVAYLSDATDPHAPWDSYQCKHYAAALTPTDIYAELAKLCYYTHIGEFTIPRKYHFVAPHGVGTKLHNLLKKPGRLRAALIEKWDQYCRYKIHAGEVPLDAPLLRFIESFNFSIIWFLTPQEILEQHERTKYFHRRFKLSPPKRPEVTTPPDALAPSELRYVSCLLAAYGQRLKCKIAASEDLIGTPRLHDHFKRSRYYFYSAEALGRFSRDHFATMDFDNVKRHIHDGVADITLARHLDGFDCVLAVTQAATAIDPPISDLTPHVYPADKIGLCHHLANDGMLSWCADA